MVSIAELFDSDTDVKICMPCHNFDLELLPWKVQMRLVVRGCAGCGRAVYSDPEADPPDVFAIVCTSCVDGYVRATL